MLSDHVVRWLPSIESLELAGGLSDAPFLHLDVIHDCQPSAAPKLKSVGETLIQFLQTRFRLNEKLHAGASAIESIQLYNNPGVTVAGWNTIQAMLEQGRVVNAVWFITTGKRWTRITAGTRLRCVHVVRGSAISYFRWNIHCNQKSALFS